MKLDTVQEEHTPLTQAADKLLDEGRITINGEIPIHGTKVTDDDKVAIDGVLVKNTKTKFTYLAI